MFYFLCIFNVFFQPNISSIFLHGPYCVHNDTYTVSINFIYAEPKFGGLSGSLTHRRIHNRKLCVIISGTQTTHAHKHCCVKYALQSFFTRTRATCRLHNIMKTGFLLLLCLLWSLVAVHSQTVPYVSFVGDILPNQWISLYTVEEDIGDPGDTVRVTIVEAGFTLMEIYCNLLVLVMIL